MLPALTLPTRFTLAMSALLLCSSCQRYAITLNEQEIYTPPKLLSDFKVDDANLRECLRQTILDQQITTAQQLTLLGCSFAGMQSLSGLGHFPMLQTLDIRGNEINSLTPLLSLEQLQTIIIDSGSASDCISIKQLQEKGVELKGEFTCR